MTRKAWPLGPLVLIAVGTSSCSDPVPPAPKGDAAFTVTGCQQYTGGIAQLDSEGFAVVPTAQGDAGARLVDGQDNSNIACSVKGPVPFRINAEISGFNRHPSAGTAYFGESIQLRIANGQINDTGQGTASVTISTATDTFNNVPSVPCTLSVTSNPALEVAGGRVFASFVCSEMVSPPRDGCRASGLFVFERCDE